MDILSYSKLNQIEERIIKSNSIPDGYKFILNQIDVFDTKSEFKELIAIQGEGYIDGIHLSGGYFYEIYIDDIKKYSGVGRTTISVLNNISFSKGKHSEYTYVYAMMFGRQIASSDNDNNGGVNSYPSLHGMEIISKPLEFKTSFVIKARGSSTDDACVLVKGAIKI